MIHRKKRGPCRVRLSSPHGLPLSLRALAAITCLLVPVPLHAQPPEVSGLEAAVAIERVLMEVIERAENSVVAIASINTGEELSTPTTGFRPDPFDRFRQDLRSSTPGDPDFVPSEYGTGVVVDAQGLILTQYHVVEHGDQHWVTLSDRKTYSAKIRAADPRSDLAILEIEATDLTPITFGDASTLRKGQIVIALGNPYAIARDGQVSASWGIVSNLARKAAQVETNERASRKPTLHHFGTLIQTDAKLNFGTSGGALLNLRGEMVGLTTSLAAVAGYESAAGYAVPIDATVRRVIDTLKEGREVEYGLLGVEPENLHPAEVRQGLQGLRVRNVWDGTPADRAGLLPGDVITHINGDAVFDADSLILHVGKWPASSTVELSYLRQERPRKVEVKLAKYPVPQESIVTNRPAPWRGITVDYPTALPGQEYQLHARAGDIDFEGCVVITQVMPDSPAWQAGVRPKMFLSHVGEQRIHDPAEFYAATTDAAGPVRIRLALPDDQQPWRTLAAE